MIDDDTDRTNRVDFNHCIVGVDKRCRCGGGDRKLLLDLLLRLLLLLEAVYCGTSDWIRSVCGAAGVFLEATGDMDCHKDEVLSNEKQHKS